MLLLSCILLPFLLAGLADVKVYGGCTRVVHGVYGGCLVATAAPSNKGNPRASVSKTF